MASAAGNGPFGSPPWLALVATVALGIGGLIGHVTAGANKEGSNERQVAINSKRLDRLEQEGSPQLQALHDTVQANLAENSHRLERLDTIATEGVRQWKEVATMISALQTANVYQDDRIRGLRADLNHVMQDQLDQARVRCGGK